MHAIPAARYLARRKRQNLLLGLLALVALCMLLLGVSVGNGVVRLPLGLSEHELALFVRLRLPRVLMGALVGAGLAMSGTLAHHRLREQRGVRAGQRPGSRWSAPSRRWRLHSAERCGSP